MAARDTLSRRQERLHHGGKRDFITAARDTLSRQQERLNHGSTRHSITAARETLSRRQETFYHGGTRQSFTAARGTPSQRHEALLHSGTRDSVSILAIPDQAAAAEILGCGAGGKNSGKVGKWESGKVAKSRFLKFLDFSWISFFEKMLKITISGSRITISRRTRRLQILEFSEKV